MSDAPASKSSETERNLVDSGGRQGAVRRAAAEADELVSRHRSLVQRRWRIRSALQILEVSEKARVALESAGQPGRRWERIDEAIKVRYISTYIYIFFTGCVYFGHFAALSVPCVFNFTRWGANAICRLVNGLSIVSKRDTSCTLPVQTS